MPAGVTYWTGIWEPSREALSKEVAQLRGALAPSAPVVSFSSGQRSRLMPAGGVIRLAGRRWALLRGLAAALERRGAVSHVFGEMDAWHLLRAVGRRPVLFTVAIAGRALGPESYGKVAQFAAESVPLADALVRAGVPANRIRIVYPGIDLARFSPGVRPPDPFRVLFASSPASAADVARRGIPSIIDAARACPEIELRLLWRTWGQSAATVRAVDALAPPPNVRLDVRDVGDMASVFQSVHATIWFPVPGHGKSCPNSVVEGLACGCPAIVSSDCGIAELIAKSGAGMVVPADRAERLADAIREIRRDFASFSRGARDLAARVFPASAFVNNYLDLYESLGCELSPEAMGTAAPHRVTV
jgi:glycosyltransferase involved in cell wall biosynthesis